MSSNYLRTFGYVLRRTNYGEADRILNILTPSGKISAIAKGVRREKSKLAGGIEMFSLIDFNLHFGRSDLGVITGAKMIKFYSEIVKDYTRMELAGSFLKKASKVAEANDAEEYFNILGQSLIALNSGYDNKLVEAWFLLNLNWASGEEINLYRDSDDKKLEVGKLYVWDSQNSCFSENDGGEYGEDEIKMLRLMVTSDLEIVRRVRVGENVLAKVLRLAQSINKI